MSIQTHTDCLYSDGRIEVFATEVTEDFETRTYYDVVCTDCPWMELGNVTVDDAISAGEAHECTDETP